MGKYNIWSGNKDWPLGAALTNCTGLARKKGNIKNQYPVTFQGVMWEDAEQAYLSLSRRCRDDGVRDRLMVDIITAKLKQHPQLKTLVDRYGGVVFLERVLVVWFGKWCASRFESSQSLFCGGMTCKMPNTVPVFLPNSFACVCLELAQ